MLNKHNPFGAYRRAGFEGDLSARSEKAQAVGFGGERF